MNDAKPSRGRVLMLVNSYAPDDSRVMTIAASLAREGYAVHLIGSARLRDDDVPTRVQIGTVEILILPHLAKRSVRRLLPTLWQLLRGTPGESIRASSTHRSTFLSLFLFNLWVLRLGAGKPADVIHCHDFSPLPAAWLLARMKRARLIYDSHENAPDLHTGRKASVIAAAEKWLIRRVDAVITVGERLARSLSERGGRNLVVIGNWKRREDFAIDAERLEVERQKLNLARYRLVISYIGTLTPDRMIEPLLQAVAETPDVALLIAGRGTLNGRITAVAQQNANIYWLGWLNLAQLPLYTHLSDVIYYCLDPALIRQAYFSTPNKLFEAFATGKAMIARHGIGEIAEILAKYPAGVMLDEVTPASIQSAFERLKQRDLLEALQVQARRGGAAYNWNIAEERLHGLYRELMSEDTTSSDCANTP